ncbi:hypothetical protein Syun_022685 [Stephania yunnanensis]|uniref:gibberellin 3beta-dioxygenase n=1 Tax=Stephania yunnanensis TaxID=152371 RepID=A0AAP0FLE3_9MAGN
MSSTLSDAFRAVPVHIHQNVNLDFESAREVPDSHTWQDVDDYPSVDAAAVGGVPVVDLNDPNAMKLVSDACEKWGLFQVVNHGVPVSLLQDFDAQLKRLFSLPTERKLKAVRLPDDVSGYGLVRISSFFPKIMWYEGFTIVGSPVEHARQLWPEDHTQDERLAGRILWLALGGLGITKPDLEWAGPNGEFEEANAGLQLNSYPVCPDPKKTMGLANHTDSTIITVVYQNNESGLQLLKDGSWVMVPALDGALVVNVGDLLHILSNGKYPSVFHRAIVHQTRYRLSAAYLFGPPPNIHVAPLEKLIDHNNPPLYKSLTWNEYLETKTKHFNKTLGKLRIASTT